MHFHDPKASQAPQVDDPGGGHPLLLGTGAALPGDTSVDTSAKCVRNGGDLSGPHQAEEVRGAIGAGAAQGPAGVAVPDLEELPAAPAFEDAPGVGDAEYEFQGDPDAPQDAHGEGCAPRRLGWRLCRGAGGTEHRWH
jgi:hypothetical protein